MLHANANQENHGNPKETLTHTHKTSKNSGRRGFTYYNPTSNFQKF